MQAFVVTRDNVQHSTWSEALAKGKEEEIT